MFKRDYVVVGFRYYFSLTYLESSSAIRHSVYYGNFSNSQAKTIAYQIPMVLRSKEILTVLCKLLLPTSYCGCKCKWAE